MATPDKALPKKTSDARSSTKDNITTLKLNSVTTDLGIITLKRGGI